MSSRRPVGTLRAYDPLSSRRFVRSQASYVWDDQGRRYLDMICGYSACNLGHAHPELLSPLQEQLGISTWAHGGESPDRANLEESLASLVESHTQRPTKVWLTVSGARANEIAWKAAFAKKPGGVVRFDLAYHGRSLATALLSDPQRSDAASFGTYPAPWLPHERSWSIPFPKHLHGVCGRPILDPQSNTSSPLCEECVKALAQAAMVFEKNQDQLSILFLEPVIGARGYYFAPAQYLVRLVELARNYGLVVVADEIQMGLRRLGSMVASAAQGWDADLVVFGKSLGGGILPIAAVVGDQDCLDSLPPGFESETFAAYPLACRVALAALKLLSPPNLGEHIEREGRFFRKALRERLPDEIFVDGEGLATVISLEHLGPAGTELARTWVRQVADIGLLVHLTGIQRSRIALLPPVNGSREELGEAVNLLHESFPRRQLARL